MRKGRPGAALTAALRPCTASADSPPDCPEQGRPWDEGCSSADAPALLASPPPPPRAEGPPLRVSQGDYRGGGGQVLGGSGCACRLPVRGGDASPDIPNGSPLSGRLRTIGSDAPRRVKGGGRDRVGTLRRRRDAQAPRATRSERGEPGQGRKTGRGSWDWVPPWPRSVQRH